MLCSMLIAFPTGKNLIYIPNLQKKKNPTFNTSTLSKTLSLFITISSNFYITAIIIIIWDI